MHIVYFATFHFCYLGSINKLQIWLKEASFSYFFTYNLAKTVLMFALVARGQSVGKVVAGVTSLHCGDSRYQPPGW